MYDVLLERVTAGSCGWQLTSASTRRALVVDGVEAVGITRWEGRQVAGLLGLVLEINNGPQAPGKLPTRLPTDTGSSPNEPVFKPPDSATYSCLPD